MCVKSTHHKSANLISAEVVHFLLDRISDFLSGRYYRLSTLLCFFKRMLYEQNKSPSLYEISFMEPLKVFLFSMVLFYKLKSKASPDNYFWQYFLQVTSHCSCSMMQITGESATSFDHSKNFSLPTGFITFTIDILSIRSSDMLSYLEIRIFF